jgi:NAD(P)-dependent dehydrogenase (short-subunit alcohol dehydrogenase family)
MSDFLGYAGKRVIVSGCFSGMGEATARTLLEVGAEVHGLDFKASALPLASFAQVDLRDRASINAAVAGLSGSFDALFNCAGLAHTWPPLDVMKVNYVGTRHLTERVIPLMPNGGAIASISSTGAMGWRGRIPLLRELIALDGWDAIMAWCESDPVTVREGYALSKELINIWTMVASAKLIRQGIRINAIEPGPTQTPMMNHFEEKSSAATLEAALQPINRRSTPEEQARPLVFLNSAAASYINGAILPVDGGFMTGMAMGTIDTSIWGGGPAKD